MRWSHTKVVGPAGRFGARYGMGLRKRVVQVEAMQRGKHRCPRCKSRVRFRRVAFGIWVCPKCDYTFAGGAFIPLYSK